MVVVFLLACVALWFLDILRTAPPPEGVKCKARILSVDNSNIFRTTTITRNGIRGFSTIPNASTFCEAAANKTSHYTC